MTRADTTTERRWLVFGDDGSRGADIAWLWINSHSWKALCCVDGSAHAARALDAFAALPLAADVAEVTVLAVDDGRVDVDVATSTALDALHAVGVDARAERGSGAPTRIILEHLDAQQPQLVVLGTKGLTGWRRLRLGSTAAAVVHHAACTSLLACADETGTPELDP